MSGKKIDPEIMDELLNTPEVKPLVQDMTPETLAWYKDMLVSMGIYNRYVEERKK